MPRTLAHFRSGAARAQAQAQSAKSFLAFWNRPKLVLQTLGKFGIRLQALDRKLVVPRSFALFRSAAAHAQAEVKSAKSLLAIWNQSKLVLQTLGEIAIRLQVLDLQTECTQTLAHFRAGEAHAQAQAKM